VGRSQTQRDTDRGGRRTTPFELDVPTTPDLAWESVRPLTRQGIWANQGWGRKTTPSELHCTGVRSRLGVRRPLTQGDKTRIRKELVTRYQGERK